MSFHCSLHLNVVALGTTKAFDQRRDGAKWLSAFQHILERANYILLPESIVQRALGKKSLIDLKTQVDFDDFERFCCYYQAILTRKFR
jgi:hypothetical protein